ncbi:unnamed protein product [Cuscuta epithymum]|uniref:Protein argonaute 2-like n=1 Tax=Cuscuta epithymum TaxID=186058 RepID=A0AAV0FZW6_9ASTE|nr:unnamed protein product [Cuscuta epithymum]
MEGENFPRGRGRGRGRGGGGGRGGYDPSQQVQGGSGGGRGGRGSGSQRGGHNQAPAQNQWEQQRPRGQGPADQRPQQQWARIPVSQGGGAPSGGPQRPQFQQSQSPQPNYGSNRGPAPWGGAGRPPPQQSQSQSGGGWGPRPRAWSQRPPIQQQPPQYGGDSGPTLQQPQSGPQGTGPTGGPPPSVWSGKPRGVSMVSSPSPPPTASNHPQAQSQPQSQSFQMSSVPTEVGARTLSSESSKNKLQPIKRPDTGTIATRKINLLVNHFRVTFRPETTIMHYDVAVNQVNSENQPLKKSISKSLLSIIRKQLFNDNPQGFPVDMTTYDGEKNIFSVVPLPTGEFKVVLSGDDESKSRTFMFTIKLVGELKYSKLKDYLSGVVSHLPREILQAMDLVMKDNPTKSRYIVGRSFFSKQYTEDLVPGIAAHRGFQQSLKPTSQGLALCLDYSVLAFRKPLAVLEFLHQYIDGFRLDQFNFFRKKVAAALIGLKVNVTHRRCSQKFIISNLTEKNTGQLTFVLTDPDGNSPARELYLVDYFLEKHGKKIVHTNIPCLDIGKGRYVPMEFCILIGGQIFPKENLDKDTGIFLKKLSLPPPEERRRTINAMVKASDGPSGDVSKNFGIGVEHDMTQVVGRILPPPKVKLGGSYMVSINDRCQWNLVGKTVVAGTPVERWALIDFTISHNYNKLRPHDFIANLKRRSKNMGIHMEDPLIYQGVPMRELSSVTLVENLLNHVVDSVKKKTQAKLQIIVCVMPGRDNGYKYLKWVSETKIGVVTQCCLSGTFNKGRDQDLANLCKKINAKLGGSNFELHGRLPHFQGQEHVMFIGADVNHPAARNVTCPSIAAVVGTVNWPAANRYAARVCPQKHRTETILNFGSMCSDLVYAYAKTNNVRPMRIVVFRDGVSEGQFEIVLNEELIDMKKKIYTEDYQPPITFIVAQKRHQTRLFLQNRNDGGASANVPPGTVVDTTVVHPSDFDFYLCSHYGSLGTSKPTHYYALWDENRFTSDGLQKLIYDMCFTFARCAKAVSLVPPVYYADLVAYRGRMFQEVVNENQNAGSSSSSSGPSFKHEFYNLHPDLKNIMFFI